MYVCMYIIIYVFTKKNVYYICVNEVKYRQKLENVMDESISKSMEFLPKKKNPSGWR